MEEAHPDFLLQRERDTEHLTCDVGKKKTRSLPEDTQWLVLLLPQEETREGSCSLSIKPQPPVCTSTEWKGQRSSSCFLKHHQRNEEDTAGGHDVNQALGGGAVASRSAPTQHRRGSWRWAGFQIHDASKEDPGGVCSPAPCTTHWTLVAKCPMPLSGCGLRPMDCCILL